MTVAIGHKSDKTGRVVLDCLREFVPPFRPASVVSEIAETLRHYKIQSITADRYAGEWVVAAFKDVGVDVAPCPVSASDLYLEILPAINSGSVEFLDHKRMISQFVGLERRTRSGGRDLITHFPGAHDDLANAAAGVFYVLTAGAVDVPYIGFTRHNIIGGPERPDVLSRADIEEWDRNR